MLDIETLRLTLGSLSLVVLMLFYVGVYRPTRSSFAGWWSLSLVSSFVSPGLLLLNGTELQVIANPLSSLVTVFGCTCVWFATRSLRDLPVLPWVLWSLAPVVFFFALLDSPSTNRWAGNGLLFAIVAGLFLLAAFDMWKAWLDRRQANALHDGEARVALLVSALAASLLGVFYSWRVVALMTFGHESIIFDKSAGSGPTAIILLITLVAVAFSVSALGYDQQTKELRRRVAYDDLTGVLGRSAFFERASARVRQVPTHAPALFVVVADLDHFKAVNDQQGHAAGDSALVNFGEACRAALNKDELAGRLGGEEFALLLNSPSTEAAQVRVEALSRNYALAGADKMTAMPTVSFGIAPAERNRSIDRSLARADAAMYRAKATGRDRVVVDAKGDGRF